MVQQQTQDLLNYWNQVRQGRQAPKRIEITPSDISPLLPVTFILEVTKDKELKFRLAGSKMCEIFGKEFRGLNFFDCWPPMEQSILSRHLSQLINEGTIVTINCEAKAPNGETAECEILFLPLTHSGTTIDRILGAVTLQEDHPWIGLIDLEFHMITEIHTSYIRLNILNETSNTPPSKLAFLPHKRLVQGKNCQLRVFDGGKTD